MRVTDSILKNTFLMNLNFSSERLFEKETKVLTGKAVNKPSDNPVDALNALVLRSRVDEIKQYQRNISSGKSTLQNSETLVYQVSELFQRVSELAVQGASDSYGPNDKLSISYEINQLLEQLMVVGNSKTQSTYIFAGTQNNIKPYIAIRDDSGDITQVTTTGSSGDIMKVIGEGITLKSNVNGEELFEGGEDLFQLLIDMRDHLEASQTSELTNDIQRIDQAQEKILNILAVIGSRVNRVEAAESRAESDVINYTQFLSNAEDIDAAEAITEYQMELLSLQSALQAGARLLRPRLGDFLK